jgi:hypothetical protein
LATTLSFRTSLQCRIMKSDRTLIVSGKGWGVVIPTSQAKTIPRPPLTIVPSANADIGCVRRGERSLPKATSMRPPIIRQELALKCNWLWQGFERDILAKPCTRCDLDVTISRRLGCPGDLGWREEFGVQRSVCRLHRCGPLRCDVSEEGMVADKPSEWVQASLREFYQTKPDSQ